MRGTHGERQRHRQREKQAPSGEPEVVLDPRAPGSQPEPKADAQPLSHPAVPNMWRNILFIYSWERQREKQRHRQREKQAPCEEPDMRFDPRTPGSRPEPKSRVRHLTHWAIQVPLGLLVRAATLPNDHNLIPKPIPWKLLFHESLRKREDFSKVIKDE